MTQREQTPRIDLSKYADRYSTSKTKVLDHIEEILFLKNRDASYAEIAAILESDLNVKIAVSWLKEIVQEHIKKHPQTTEVGRVPGAPAQAPSAPQANQVAQVLKAPIQTSQAVQSSGSPVKEVKAPVSVTEPAKEVKTTSEGRKAEEVKPAGVQSSREEVENMLREQNEERGALEISMAHLRASFGGPALTLARATSYMGRPVTEEELPSLIARGNQLRAAGRSEIFG